MPGAASRSLRQTGWDATTSYTIYIYGMGRDDLLSHLHIWDGMGRDGLYKLHIARETGINLIICCVGRPNRKKILYHHRPPSPSPPPGNVEYLERPFFYPCSYEELTGFVRAVKAAGVDHVIVHARKCLLNGLSTTANRTVPPLRYDVVHRLALEFPELEIVLNGGVGNLREVNDHLLGRGEWGGYGGGVAGVMVGRASYFDPWTFRHTDSAVYGSTDPGKIYVQLRQTHAF